AAAAACRACSACLAWAARNAARARNCSAVGLVAAGFLRTTGASTVTGGKDESCASAAVNDATAIMQPTVTLRPVPASRTSLIRSALLKDRSERGALIATIVHPRT